MFFPVVGASDLSWLRSEHSSMLFPFERILVSIYSSLYLPSRPSFLSLLQSPFPYDFVWDEIMADCGEHTFHSHFSHPTKRFKPCLIPASPLARLREQLSLASLVPQSSFTLILSDTINHARQTVANYTALYHFFKSVSLQRQLFSVNPSWQSALPSALALPSNVHRLMLTVQPDGDHFRKLFFDAVLSLASRFESLGFDILLGFPGGNRDPSVLPALLRQFQLWNEVGFPVHFLGAKSLSFWRFMRDAHFASGDTSQPLFDALRLPKIRYCDDYNRLHPDRPRKSPRSLTKSEESQLIPQNTERIAQSYDDWLLHIHHLRTKRLLQISLQYSHWELLSLHPSSRSFPSLPNLPQLSSDPTLWLRQLRTLYVFLLLYQDLSPLQLCSLLSYESVNRYPRCLQRLLRLGIRWSRQLRFVFSFLLKHHFSVRRLRFFLPFEPLHCTWLQDFLRLGLTLHVFTRPQRGVYRVNPASVAMLFDPLTLSSAESKQILKTITSIPQCLLLLDLLSFSQLTPNAFLMRYFPTKMFKTFDSVSFRTALALLRHYRLIRAHRVSTKGRSVVSWIKLVDSS